ncbi:MAG: hypothetical protein RRZ84_08535 [Romboutsia sp.]
MNNKKVITIGLSLMLSIGVMGCSNKNKVEDKKVTQKTEVTTENPYTTHYTTGYNDYIAGLEQYSIYSNPGEINKIYENKEYPGNEKYVNDLTLAYKDSSEKIKSFTESLKANTKIEDTNIKKMNDDLVAEGEKLVTDIDTRLKQLEAIPKETYSKSKEEFSKAVTEATVIKNSTENKFNQMIKDMNLNFGINKK